MSPPFILIPFYIILPLGVIVGENEGYGQTMETFTAGKNVFYPAIMSNFHIFYMFS